MSGLKAYKNKHPFLAKKWILKDNKTYIVPTGFGFSFGAVTLVLLVLSIGFANNLLYFFAFLLVSMAITGMWLTNKNVDSAELVDMQCEFLFAGEKNNLTVYLKNSDFKNSIWSSELQLDTKQNSLTSPQKIDEIKKLQKVNLTWTPKKRGFVDWPSLLFQSRFPYKMLKAWKYFSKSGTVLIYPQRVGTTELPQEIDGNSPDSEPENSEDHELFRDFRPFQQTDSPLRIDWKKSLKHQKHLVKNFESSQHKKIVIDWNSTEFLKTFEDRISQLALWIDICEEKNNLYSLRIKSFQTAFGRNTMHYRLCLEKLAVLEENETA